MALSTFNLPNYVSYFIYWARPLNNSEVNRIDTDYVFWNSVIGSEISKNKVLWNIPDKHSVCIHETYRGEKWIMFTSLNPEFHPIH